MLSALIVHFCKFITRINSGILYFFSLRAIMKRSGANGKKLDIIGNLRGEIRVSASSASPRECA